MSGLINANLLERPIAAVQDKMGDFLKAKQTLLEIGDRLDNVLTYGNAEAKEAGHALERQQQLLLARQRNLENSLLQNITNAKAVQDEATKYAKLFSQGFAAGTREIEIVKDVGSKLLQTGRNLAGFAKLLDNHLRDVDDANKKLLKLEGHANETPGVFRKTTGMVTDLKWVVLGVGGLMLLFYAGPFLRSLAPSRR